MLLKNLSVATRLVNGSRGVVVGFASEKEQALKNVDADTPGFQEIYEQLVKSSQLSDEKFPVVKFTNGIEKLIQIDMSSIEVAGKEVAYRKQIPLALAWAVSVHKAQGMTLERVELSLKNVFECGQAYVALSRCTTLEGLRLDDFSQDKVRAHPTVLAYYKKLEDKVAEKVIGHSNNRKDTSVSGGCFSSLQRNEVLQGGTSSEFYPRWNGHRQKNMTFPGFSGVKTVGNKLFKSSTTASSPNQGDSKSTNNRGSMKRKNDLFVSRVKQAKIDVERYYTENSKSIDENFKLNPIEDTNSRKYSDLIVID